MKKLFLIASIFACSVTVANAQTTKKEVSSGKKVNAPAMQADPSKQAVKPVNPTTKPSNPAPASTQKQENPTPKPAAPSVNKEEKKVKVSTGNPPLKKDGTPDKRFKDAAVKETKTVITKTKAKTRSRKTEAEEKEDMKETTASKAAEKKVKDKVTGTYNGKKVFTGTRGGKYYINKNGNKTYIDRDAAQ